MAEFVLRDTGDGEKTPLVLRPIHVALAAFVATLPVYEPTVGVLAAAPLFGELADSYLFALLVALCVSSAVVLVRGLQSPARPLTRSRVVLGAAIAYGAGLLAMLGLSYAGVAHPFWALAAGVLVGAAIPPLVAEWARTVAVTMDEALVLAAFVMLTSSFVDWVLTVIPTGLAVALFVVLVVVGVGLLPLTARVPREPLADARPGKAVESLVSVTWLPLAGMAVYAFMTGILAYSAFGVVQASFLGGVGAAIVMFGVCFLWGRRPLLPWCYRILVPLVAAVFVVLGAFPADTFPKDASIVALYVFYLTLAMIGCAVFLAVVHAREVAADVAAGFACATVGAAALLAFIVAQVLQVTDDFGPWLTVITGAFIAVLLVYLGRTSWSQLITPHGVDDAVSASDAEIAQAGGAFTAEPSVQDALDARCAELSARFELSPREAEILVYLARGFSPAYIAKSLVLSVSTVRTHVRNIYRKLGIGKREELIHLVDDREGGESERPGA